MCGRNQLRGGVLGSWLRDQDNQVKLDIRAVTTVLGMIMVRRLGRRFIIMMVMFMVMMATVVFMMLHDLDGFMRVATTNADDNAFTQASEHALERDGSEQKAGCGL